MITFC